MGEDDRESGRPGRGGHQDRPGGGRQTRIVPLELGEDEHLAIIDAPDDVTAGSVAIAVASSGSLRNLRTIKVITPEEGRKLLEKAKAAKAAKAAYAPPGVKAPAGVR